VFRDREGRKKKGTGLPGFAPLRKNGGDDLGASSPRSRRKPVSKARKKSSG